MLPSILLVLFDVSVPLISLSPGKPLWHILITGSSNYEQADFLPIILVCTLIASDKNQYCTVVCICEAWYLRSRKSK